MSVRSLKFEISAAREPQKTERVWGGMQYEDNATEFCFKPDTELLSEIGDNALFRIDFNGIAGYDPSENLSADSGGYYTRLLPYSMTRYDGEIEVVFVITSNQIEILSFPITVYLTRVQRDAVSSDEVHTHISQMEQTVRELGQQAAEAAEKTENASEITIENAENVAAMHNELKDIYISAAEIKAVKEESEELIGDIEARLANGEFKGEKGDKGDKGERGDQGIQGIQGEKGEKGEPFTYSDFTDEQLSALKGEKGDKGDMGDVSLPYANATFSNALKGNKNGSVILIDDVSPVEHMVGVKLSGENVSNLSAEKLNVHGRNLFCNLANRTVKDVPYANNTLRQWDGKSIVIGLAQNNSTYTAGITNLSISNENISFTTANNIYGVAFDFPCIQGKKQRLILNSNVKLRVIHLMYDKDGNVVYSNVSISENGDITTAVPVANAKWYVISVTAQDANSDTGVKVDVTINNPYSYIYEDNANLPYQPYVEPVKYTPNADGTVENVTSIYPNMTLFADTAGIIIECEYNKDLNKSFTSVLERLAALESAAANS